jgi:hypothetical protein
MILSSGDGHVSVRFLAKLIQFRSASEDVKQKSRNFAGFERFFLE